MPPGHVVQLLAPLEEYVPAGQTMQLLSTVAPGNPYVPAEHVFGQAANKLVWPGMFPYRPG